MGVVFLLVCFGIATIYGIASASENPDFIFVKKQAVFAVIGFIVLFMMSSINYKFLSSYSKHIYILSIISLILVLIFGDTIRGTKGWFNIFGFGIQPVEFAKFGLIVVLAQFFSKAVREIDRVKNVVMSAVYVGIFVMLVLMQPDFGSALSMIAIWLGLLLISKIKRLHVLILMLLILVMSVFSWFFVFKDYQKERIMVFLDPARDPLGRGYNLTQARIAVGSGQLYGRGLGYGSQSQLKFLPESQTDFIFAVIAEEFGFLGIMIIVFLWIILFWRIVRAAKLCENDFGLFLVLGVCTLFFTQIMINTGMNIGLAPVTGISLPFISYGGSFLIISLLLVGVVQSVVIRK